MIELPFGNGITAAIVFFIFELVVIPVLIDSTSKAATFFAYRRAKMGIHVQATSFQYPLWNEGLFSRQWSHMLLFLFRIVCIIIPFYLETRLENKEQPVMVTKRLPHAFVLTPKGGQLFKEKLLFQNRTSDFSYIFHTCSYIDAEGWLIARVANVTYIQSENLEISSELEDDRSVYELGYNLLPDEYRNSSFPEVSGDVTSPNVDVMYQVFCLDGTEKGLFRIIEFSDFQVPHSRDREVTLHLSAKSVGSFSQRDQLKINVILSNENGTECFIPGLATRLSSKELFTLYCHEKRGTYTYLYLTFVTADVFRMQNTSGDTTAKELVNIVPESSTQALKFIARIEFKEEIMLDTEALVAKGLTNIGPELSDMYHDLGLLFYSKTENESVTVAGDSVHELTILDTEVIIIGAIELVFVFLFGLGTQLCFVCYAHSIQKPNMVDGLSESWSRALAPASASMENNRIRLKLRKRIVRGVERYAYEPATTYDHCAP